MTASSSPPVSRARRLLAGASLLGVAGLIAREGLLHRGWGWPLPVLFGAMLTLGAVGITLRSLVAQVLSRAGAWIVLLPVSLGSLFLVLDGRAPPLEIVGLGVGSAAALLLARPMLHTREARAEFAPTVYRRWLLAGSTATAATGLVAGGLALALVREDLRGAACVAALAASLLASSLAVVRMRAWGIFLGAFTSAALLVAGVLLGRDAAFFFSLVAAPAVLLHLLPVLVARLRSGRAKADVRAHPPMASALGQDARYRVAASELDELDADPVPEAERAAMRA